MGISIGDNVNVKSVSSGEYWKGKVVEIRANGRWFIVEDDNGINSAVLNIDNLIFKDGEWWENVKV